MPALAVLAMVAVAAGFGVWQAAFRVAAGAGGGRPGVYLQYGHWIAVHGTVRVPSSAAGFGGAAGLDFATTGFSVSGGFITPSFVPGLPLVLAGGAWLGGLGGALLMPAVLGGCAVLSFGGLAGRLVGAWQAVAGELVLAVCLPEVYVSRTPMAEPLVQVLLFGGLCLFTDSFAVRRRDAGGRGGPGGGLALAGLGGLALGLTVLASVGSLATLLPVFPVLAVLFVARRPQAGPFGLGFFARHRDRAGGGAGARAALPGDRVGATAPDRAVRGRVRRGDGAGRRRWRSPARGPGCAGSCAFNVRFKWFKGEKLVLPSLGIVRRSGWPSCCRSSRSSGWPTGRTSRPFAGRPIRP